MFHDEQAGQSVSATWSPRWPGRAAQIACGHEVSGRGGGSVGAAGGDRAGDARARGDPAGPVRRRQPALVLGRPDPAVAADPPRRGTGAAGPAQRRGVGAAGGAQRPGRPPAPRAALARRRVAAGCRGRAALGGRRAHRGGGGRRGAVLPRAAAGRPRRGVAADAGPLLAAESLRGARRPVRGGRRRRPSSGRDCRRRRAPQQRASGHLRRRRRRTTPTSWCWRPARAPGRCWPGSGWTCRCAPHLEQVVHFGDPADPGAADELPCLYDGPRGDEPGAYTMPTPGVGYKVGLDSPLRDLLPGDEDRTPDAALVARTTERVRRDLTAVHPHALDAQVCCWTDSPDGRFVIDTLPAARSCSPAATRGEGFKFSALMGLVLADLAEGSRARRRRRHVRPGAVRRRRAGSPARTPSAGSLPGERAARDPRGEVPVRRHGGAGQALARADSDVLFAARVSTRGSSRSEPPRPTRPSAPAG